MTADKRTESAPRSLEGIRVLDMSRILAGPWVGQTLGDLGAEVVKIERPQAGDDTRGWGPPFLQDEQGQDTDVASYFLCANRNKKSVTIDIAKPRGQALVRALAEHADVLIENFKVGGLAQYGLDYASLRAVNSRLIYCSITGFGQTGPYADRAGYDFLIQAMGGLMSITGEPNGEPQKTGVAITDIVTGLYATVGVLAALTARTRTGEGQHLDIALLDAQVASLANQSMNFLTTGKPPIRLGNSHPNIVPYQDFPTSDGAVIVAVGNDAQFSRLCEIMGSPEWATDPLYSTNRGRVENRARLVPMLAQATRARATADWIVALEAVDVPCGPVNTIAEVFADPHVQARGIKVELPHPKAGRVPLVASPVRLSQTPVVYDTPPPALGEHTAEVLAGWLSLGPVDIETLQTERII
ncbi:CoA transferase [Mesorhizobium waimense]|uniref:CoA transferase n=1 Tax=Mesorhizobium waimense TaxID=1300307 RepID=A0A3A5L4A1_9HYPH|nr:CaiB/BaiF CoA-transferase family protein [Mesorhizobium waimense]RJT41453.1 CoA transferase [Mesorhizobium waimense]